jgi:hypothetical protein
MSGPHAAAGGRNYGYGRDMGYAGSQALQEYYGGGHYSSVATHADRFGQFASWAKDQGIRDLARNDPQQLLESYSRHVGELKVSAAYAQNLISSAQVTMRAMTGDESIRVRPSDYTDPRNNVRTEAPGSLDRSNVAAATESMRDAGLDRAAAVADLAREFGMRSQEATLADLGRLDREAKELGQVNITDGTKGGRDAERLVSVTESGRAALDAALAASPADSRNLLSPGESWREFRDGELRDGREHLQSAGIQGYHDARAGYGCERYAELTGQDAPCVSGQSPADRNADRDAREQIGYELGHGRSDVLVSYVGGRS